MELPVRIPSSPPRIAPLEDQTSRPRWSVMVPVYNCASYLRDTLESILVQDPGPGYMQIEVCDDASTDGDIAGLVREIGSGRIGYTRQPFNVGSLRNFETCLQKSRGHLVHLLHGDDMVKPGFYEKMEALLEAYPLAGAAFSGFVTVDEYNGRELVSEPERETPGLLEHWLERLARKQRIQTPAMVVRRSVYEQLGAFYGVHYGEDWEMWLRIASHYETAYHPETLAVYRKHAASISGQYIRTGQNIRDLKVIMGIAEGYFRPAEWKTIGHAARKFYAHYAINTARSLWGREHHRAATVRQIREALGLAVDPEILYESAKLCAKMMIGLKR